MQALNAGDVPLAVDKCTSFIALYGEKRVVGIPAYFSSLMLMLGSVTITT